MARAAPPHRRPAKRWCSNSRWRMRASMPTESGSLFPRFLSSPRKIPTMKKTLLACIAAAGFALPALAQQQLTVVNFGGANANAQKKAYYEPYEKTGTKIIPVEYNGE